MSQNDDGSAFLHSDELRASWVHLRESLLEGPSVASFFVPTEHSRGRVCTDVRNRQAFAQKLTVIATELRKRMVRILFTPESRSCTDYSSEKL